MITIHFKQFNTPPASTTEAIKARYRYLNRLIDYLPALNCNLENWKADL